jgi:hypothetical protein
MFPKPNNDQLIEAHKNGKTMFDLQGGMQNIAAGSLITLGGLKADGTATTILQPSCCCCPTTGCV